MANLRNIIHLLHGHRLIMLAGILASTLVVAMNAALMALSGWFITSMALAGASGLAFNYFYASATIRALAITRTLGRYGERLLTHAITLDFLVRCRTWLFTQLAPRIPVPFERFTAGELSGRLRHDLDSLEALYLRGLAPVLTGIMVTLGAYFFICRYDSAVALVFAVLAIAVCLCWPLLRYRRSYAQGQALVQSQAQLRHAILQGLQGAEELLLLGALKEQAQSLKAISDTLIEQQQTTQRDSHLYGDVILTTAGVVSVLLIAILTEPHLNTHIQGPHVVMLLLFSLACFEALTPMALAIHGFPQSQAALTRIIELAEAPIEVNHGIEPAPGSYDITCEQVGLLRDQATPLQKTINFTIPQGTLLAIQGESGAGKSTLLETLSGLRPYLGSIRIGGRELRDIHEDDLHSIIQVAPQTPHLFDGTLRENIVMGRESTDDALTKVLYGSALEQLIAQLPDGLETRVGEQGRWISGGEAKRVALARAYFTPAPILLLDEPTEGLDLHMEQMVLQRMKELLTGRTIIVATHRRAAANAADSTLSI